MPKVLLVLLLLTRLVAGESPDWYAEARELYYGIPVTVRFTPRDDTLAARVWKVLEAIDQDFNDYRNDSEIGKINAGGPGEYRLNPSLLEAFTLAGRMREASNGACEITVGPLRRLWKGAAKSGVWPDDARIAEVRAAVGPQVYRLDGDRLTVLRPGVAFDFGGVCKGMAVDRAVALLKAAGCTAALVQVGGETGCWGIAPAHRPHRLAIPNPLSPDDEAHPYARLQDPGQGMCGSTSGNYRLPITVQGRTLYHIYDPRTGLTADTKVLSFSIVFPGSGRNGEADSMCKSGILLGDAALALVERLGGQAMLLRRGDDGTVIESHTTGWHIFAAPEVKEKP